jgi:LmbE family N-acetylglucosaminyl deacetylase
MKTIVIAPHPDDETLGVGGTLLKRKREGGILAWLIVTSISEQDGWGVEKVENRRQEIKQISKLYGFDEVYELNFPATSLDTVPIGDIIKAIAGVFKEFLPDEIFLPNPTDVHSDHRIVFEAAVSCTKCFRYSHVKRVLAYETLSETDFSLSPGCRFSPNVFVNIEDFLEGKLKALSIYKSELGEFPFPRSQRAITALANVRGAASGFIAAEAFELLRERS